MRQQGTPLIGGPRYGDIFKNRSLGGDVTVRLKAALSLMAEDRDGLRFLVPWRLFNGSSRESVAGRIWQAVAKHWDD
jgi:hypothetical protein